MTLERKEFFDHIKEDFFEELTADFEGFKNMVHSVLPVFGTLETNITENEDGGKKIQFIDVDHADMVFAPKGIDPNEVNTDMTTTVMTLHLNEQNTIQIVEHGMHLFTPANKEKVLLLASFIGKKITF